MGMAFWNLILARLTTRSIAAARLTRKTLGRTIKAFSRSDSFQMQSTCRLIFNVVGGAHGTSQSDHRRRKGREEPLLSRAHRGPSRTPETDSAGWYRAYLPPQG